MLVSQAAAEPPLDRLALVTEGNTLYFHQRRVDFYVQVERLRGCCRYRTQALALADDGNAELLLIETVHRIGQIARRYFLKSGK